MVRQNRHRITWKEILYVKQAKVARRGRLPPGCLEGPAAGEPIGDTPRNLYLGDQRSMRGHVERKPRRVPRSAGRARVGHFFHIKIETYF